MGPDGAVVVAERVEAGVVGRHRAHAPARPERRAHELVDDAGDALGRDDPGEEQVADVRRERVDAPLLAVERERVEAAALLDPERLVEPLRELGGLALEPVGEVAVAPRDARHLGEPELRRVDVALHLARARSGRSRSCRRGSAASPTSPSTTAPRARGRSGARTRRSRRRRGRPTRRSTRAPPAPAPSARSRAPRRPSSARPRRAGRGRAASRRRCRSSARTS